MSLLIGFWGSSISHAKIKKKFGDYLIHIVNNENNMQGHLKVTKDSITVFEEIDIGSHYYWGNRSNPKAEKASLPQKLFVISKWSGGAHCCNSLYIFDTRNGFRIATIVEALSSQIEYIDVDHDEVAEIRFRDGAIDYQFASFAFSPGGKVILKWNGDEYKASRSMMSKSTPTSKNLQTEKVKIRLAFGRHPARSELPYELLSLMMNLSYTGNLQEALKIAKDTWPAGRPGLPEFQSQFSKAIRYSRYWQEAFTP